MGNEMSEKIRYHLWNIPIYICAGVLSFWLFWPLPEKTMQINEESHIFTPSKARAGDKVYIHREYKVFEPVDVRITRKFVKQEEGQIHIYNIPTVETHRKPGVYRHNRLIKIPDEITPGHYLFSNHICYKHNPLREVCHDSVPVPIEIIE